MKTLENKLIIYDSNCRVCSSLKEVVVKLSSIPESKIKAYKDLSPDLSPKVDPGKFKNEMALIDTGNAITLYGAEGVAYIFSSKYKLIDLLLGIKPLFRIFKFLYRVQAYNRYIIATPKSKFHCDCFPEKVIPFRLAYIGITVTLSVLLTILFGISLKGFFADLSSKEAAIQMLLMAGSGWVLQILAAGLLLKDKALDYIGHLGSIMVVGLLILVPSMVLTGIAEIQWIWLPALSVFISSMGMLYLHIHRVKHLEISQAWTFSWFLFLQATASLWVYFFYIK